MSVFKHNDELHGSNEAPLDVVIEVLACITQADGEVCEDEVATAKSILANLAPEDMEKVRLLYRSAVNYYSRSERRDSIFKLIQPLPLQQKLSVLRMLWAFALCDGEVHPSESAMIMEVMHQCGIDANLATFAEANRSV